MDTNFSVTEEAFLLRSLKEVVNVWARGSGQATFSLNINNGVADLQLGFQLGLPCDAHLHHHQHGPVHQHHLPSQDQQVYQGRRKTPSRRNRDRVRAAQHQAASYQQSGSAAAAAPGNKAVVASATALILPFHGKLLPLDQPSTLSSAEVSPATAPVATPPPSIPASAAAAAPTKSVGTPARNLNLDASSAKKNLFLADHHRPPTQDPPSRNFQKNEEILWTKLFSI